MWLDTIMQVFPLEEKIEELRKFSDLVILETCKYARETTEHLAIAFVAYICLCIVFYYLSVYLKSASDYGQLSSVKRVLFVTAHPDDECMFFGPAILKLAQRKDCDLYLLCLSQGNYDQQGSIRRQELYDSCKILGIPDSNIMLYKNEYLPDNPKVRWREDIVAQLLLNHIEALDIDTVITFDKLGVSGHQNHVSIFYATAYLCMERKLPTYCRAYALESINKLRKYSVMLDVPISFLLSSYWYIIPLRDRNIIKRAMAAHKSQNVWFRKLYIFFSRYCLVNTLKEIEILDLELDLELDD